MCIREWHTVQFQVDTMRNKCTYFNLCSQADKLKPKNCWINGPRGTLIFELFYRVCSDKCNGRWPCLECDSAQETELQIITTAAEILFRRYINPVMKRLTHIRSAE